MMKNAAARGAGPAARLKLDEVSVTRIEGQYLGAPPFDPPNPIYDAVIETIRRLVGDKKSAKGNPLRGIVKPGFKVIIKPNFVANRDRNLLLDNERLFASSTHPSVIRPVLDMVEDALEGAGRISIVDSPIEGSDIRDTLKRLGVYEMLNALKGRYDVPVELIDLRDFTYKRYMAADNLRIGGHSINLGYMKMIALPGDPRGYTTIDLGRASCLEQLPDMDRLAFHRSRHLIPRGVHTKGRHLYSLANSVLDADVIINMPKMKTHKKSGVTLGMKSMVGLTNRKIWLPHFRKGSPPAGDEFERPLSVLEKTLWRLSRVPVPGGDSLILNIVEAEKKEPVMDGGWQGNDTLWRTILDLVRAVLYSDGSGAVGLAPLRTCITIVDGIIAGQGDGPIRPEPKRGGILIAGAGLAAVDAACARIMGLDPGMVKTVSMAGRFFGKDLGPVDPDEIRWLPAETKDLDLRFKPPSYWPDLPAKDSPRE